MTSTKTCNLMNGYYEILKSCTIDEIEKMAEIYRAEQHKGWQTAVYCCGETIRRKKGGAWK